MPDVTRGTSTQVVEGKASRDPIMRTDGFAPCDGLVGWGCKRHCRVSRGENGSVERGNPGNRIDGTESFWGHAKDRPVKYRGMPEGLLPPSEGTRVQVQHAGGGTCTDSCFGNSGKGP